MPSRVLIYCDSRMDAVKVKELIDKKYKPRKKTQALIPIHKSELLVGERRIYERKDLEKWLEETGFWS